MVFYILDQDLRGQNYQHNIFHVCVLINPSAMYLYFVCIPERDSIRMCNTRSRFHSQNIPERTSLHSPSSDSQSARWKPLSARPKQKDFFWEANQGAAWLTKLSCERKFCHRLLLAPSVQAMSNWTVVALHTVHMSCTHYPLIECKSFLATLVNRLWTNCP